MRIASGETLVIGGLMAEQSSRSIAGVPGVRSIPGLGALFGERKDSDTERQLLVYITPYVWEPGMATPNDAAGNLRNFLDTQSMYRADDSRH
jgi:type II secretory pathway component GspD/PulD (secretin)